VKNYNKIARQAGMTLIELTVVLLVLIGLAGLMIPYVSGFVGKTHNATGSSNIAEVNTAVQRYESEFYGYPSGLDSLVSDNATPAVIDYTMAPATNYGFSIADASAAGVNKEACWSLNMAGMKGAVQMMEVPTNPTFDNASGTITYSSDDTAMATTCDQGDFVVVTPANVTTAFGITTRADALYVAYGIGQSSDLVGKTMTTAPVHFAQQGDMSASNKYNRFVVVFEAYTGTVGMTAKRAKFVGAGMAMMSLEGMNASLERHYDDVKTN